MWKEIITKTPEEEKAKDEIIRIESRMKREVNINTLWKLYIKADDLWQEYFEIWEIKDWKNRRPDHERIFVIRQELLTEAIATIVINGNINVTVNGGKVVINK